MAKRPADDPDEFEGLLAPHSELIYGFALKLTGNRPDADDVVQESLYRALRGFSGFQRGTNFRAWLLRIVSNTYLQRREKESLRAAAQLDERVAGEARQDAGAVEIQGLFSFGWESFADRLDECLKHALEALPDEFRVPLLLSSLAGLSHQEIATALRIPVGTVMSRLFRARQRVKLSIQSYEDARRNEARDERAP